MTGNVYYPNADLDEFADAAVEGLNRRQYGEDEKTINHPAYAKGRYLIMKLDAKKEKSVS